MDSLSKDEIWSPHLETIQARNAVLYKMKNVEGEAPRVFRRIFDLVEKAYGKII